MKFFVFPKVGFPLLFTLLFALGCGNHEIAPPEPLAVEQLPAAIENAFTKAKPAAKELATQVIASVQAQDYSKAFLDIQTLSASQELTKGQRSVVASAMMTINELLKSAVSKGDEKSAVTIQNYQLTK